jgi:transcriptional regulator with GAF, ATPase, and Fis domain
VARHTTRRGFLMRTEPGAAPVPDDASSDGDDISSSITELQNVLLGTESIDMFIQELAVQAARLVAGSLSCGITLSRSGKNSTVGCSGEQATAVNELQYELGEGPCLTALSDRCPVQSDDMTAETRWPRFALAAAERGVRSCLSLPLIAQDVTVGALNLYSTQCRAFGEEETRRAGNFAEPAAGALALGLRLVTYADLIEQLRASLATRAAIDQAVGIIMAQERCTQDKAFAALRTASQNRNVKLRDIAREVVVSVSGEAPQPPPFETD